jgi:hypothetical protein
MTVEVDGLSEELHPPLIRRNIVQGRPAGAQSVDDR